MDRISELNRGAIFENPSLFDVPSETGSADYDSGRLEEREFVAGSHISNEMEGRPRETPDSSRESSPYEEDLRWELVGGHDDAVFFASSLRTLLSKHAI